MSKQHQGRYTPEEVEELLTRHSREKVDALVAEADQVAAEEEAELVGGDEDDDSGDGLGDLTVAQLGEKLEALGLSKSGNKAELIARLRDPQPTA